VATWSASAGREKLHLATLTLRGALRRFPPGRVCDFDDHRSPTPDAHAGLYHRGGAADVDGRAAKLRYSFCSVQQSENGWSSRFELRCRQFASNIARGLADYDGQRTLRGGFPAFESRC